MRNIFLIAFMFVFSLNASNAQELLWAVNSDTLGFQWGESLLIDSNNNIYVGGPGANEMYLLKYDNHGTIDFANVEIGEGNFEGMTSGNNGYIYQVGARDNGLNKDAVLHVFKSDGTPAFTQTYDVNNRDDRFNDVFVDANNNIYVCGYGWRTSTDQVAVVIKYGPGGTPQWIQEFGEANYQCRFNSIHVSESGEVYAVGRKNYSSPGLIDMLIVKYDENGNFVSDYIASVGGYTECYTAFSLMDDAENIYVGGYVKNWSPPSAGFLVKISYGIQVWSQIIPSGGLSTQLEGGTFDGDGNIICYGSIYDTENDAYYAKFSSNGGLMNEKVYSNPYDQDVEFSGVFVKDEYTYICGSSEGQGTGWDIIALKLNSDFEQMWELYYNSFANDFEAAMAIAVDHDDNILLTGLSLNLISYSGVLFKFSNPLGIDDLAGTDVHPIEVFPNPAATSISFQIEIENNDARYIISNTAGQIVQSGYIDESPLQQINLFTLNNGVYFLQILDGKKQYNAKFVKK